MFQRLGKILLFYLLVAQAIPAQQTVNSLSIPAKIDFAGQTISLERYDMRERFDREQILIAYSHSTSILIIKRANRFFPIIEPILKRYNIPDDFKYLAVIESTLDPRSVSPAKAAGLWQLMPKTAEQFGLEVNDEVDERYHIEKSTEAACKYLQSAYNKFKSWTAVAASYNGGMGRISEELEKQQVDEALDLQVGSEISRYVFRILAMKQFLSNPKAFGFQLKREDFYQTIETRTVILTDSVSDWTNWASKYGISYFQLKDFNIWLRDRKLVNQQKKTYTILIPEKSDLKFNLGKVKIHNPIWCVF